jgi:hypothetical protein
MKPLHAGDFQALRRQARAERGGFFRGRLRIRYVNRLSHRATAEHLARLAGPASEYRFEPVCRTGADVEHC